MKYRKISVTIVLAALSLLSGCGGSGGDWLEKSPEIPPVLSGYWEDARNTATSATKAIVLANGDAWLLFLESGVSSRFARMQLETVGSTFNTTNGNQYLLQTGSKETASVSGTFTQKGVMNGTISATSGSTALSLAYNKTRSETPANLADAVGVWKGSYNGGSIISTLTVASTTGAVSGSSTTGCTYSGTLMPRQADPAFFDVNFTESCPAFAGTTVVTLSGIAILNETANALSFAATSVDKASGAMFTGVRQ